MYGPVIQGKLVRLRPPRPEEAAQMASWFEDLEVTERLLRRFPPTLAQEQEWLEKSGKDANTIIWAVEFDGRLVGVTGIHDIDWAQQHAVTGTLIGDKSAWRKGLAGELMQLRTEFAFRQLTLRKLNSGYVEGNEASWRAQRKSGYREVGRRRQEQFRDGRWLDLVMTEVLREDWAAAGGAQRPKATEAGPAARGRPAARRR
ncbi:MAG TPA: GNAT family protein [Candidatus Acidoferrales bacterium]|nr:GNAT family protein [Candidatus Acidoferrales bacterium]